MANERSHISIIRSGTTYPLMLAKDNQNRPKYSCSYASPLAPQQYQDEATYASSPPQQELVISQDLFNAGFGKLIRSADDSSVERKRYGCAVGVDCRIPGKVILAPLVNETTGIDSPLTNGDFETGDPPTGWNKVDAGTWERSSAEKHGGTYSGHRTGQAHAGAGSHTVYQAISTFALYKGIQITFSIWVKSSIASKVYPLVNDEGGANEYTEGNANTGTGWEQLTVNHTVTAGAIQLYVGVRISDATAEVYIDDASFTINMTDPDSAVAFAELGGELYLATRSGVYKLTAATGVWVEKYFAAGITDMTTFGDVNAKTYLLIARGAAVDYVYSEDGTTFTADPGGSEGNFFTFENENAWKAENPNEVKSTDNAIANPATWSAAVKVGDQQYNFTWAGNHLGRAYFAKANGLFTLSYTGVVTEVIPMHSTPNSDNFEQSHSSGVDQRLYCPVGQNGLLYYDDGEKDSCAPARYGAPFGDFLGQVRALASDANYNYAVTSPVGSTYATASYSIVWAMRREAIDGDTDYRWHPIAQVQIDDVRCAWVSGLLTNPRLWIAGRHTASSNENKPKYIILSRYLSPLDDSNYTYAASGFMVTPYYTANFLTIDKAFHYFTLMSQALSTGHYTITVEYEKDDSGSWVDVNQSTNGTFVTSPSQTKYFSNAPGTTEVYGKKIRFKFTLATDSSAVTPILNGFAAVCRLMADELRVFDFTIQCYDKPTGKDGSEIKLTGKAISELFHNISQDSYPVQLVDIWGTTYWVDIVAPAPMENPIAIDDPEHIRSEIRVVALQAKVA